MEKIFSDSDQFPHSSFNHQAFKVKHNLVDHKAFDIDNLAQLITELPDEKVLFSRLFSREEIGANFFLDPKSEKYENSGSLGAAIKSMETSDSFITVIDPHNHPLFTDFFDTIMTEIEGILGAQEKNIPLKKDTHSWLFIASPNSITPYHYDTSSNFLFQIKGEKIVKVFPPRHEEIISPEAYEDMLTVGPPKETGYRNDLDHLGKEFKLSAGEGLHIPFSAGHYVQNGPGEASITYSIFFQTNETDNWFSIANFNKLFRQKLKKIGVDVKPIASSKFADSFKVFAMRVINKLRRIYDRRNT
ncbi:MAG: cupin-like domain-containing protein [Oceanicoccus sp.]